MENDPLYKQGLQHLGRGEWAEAVACFTQLRVNYPNDQRVTQFLETASLRAAMGAGAERGPSSRIPPRWRQRLPVLLAVAVLLIVIGGIYLAYQTWALPAQAANARLAQIVKLSQAAQIQVASGQYANAVKTYQDILALAPDDPVIKASLERAQRLDQVAQLYAQATQALSAGNQSEAVRLLEQVNSLEANYRDTASLLDQIKSTQAVSQSYDKALELAQANNWQEAAQAFETIRTINPNYNPQEVKDYLYKAYMQLGNQQVKDATTVTAVEVADGYYQKALSVRPLDAQADAARRIAGSFFDGFAAYQAKNWETTIRLLSLVYDQQPDYFGGQVAQWLWEAYMTTGDNFLGQNDPFSARDRFAKAVSLAPGDAQRVEAQKRFEVANNLTTPTPTNQPTRTPIPSGTPLPAGYVAPAWTRSTAGSTPDPYPFTVINRTYVPNTITGHGCQWSGVAGRLFDTKGAPMTAPTLGVRVEAAGEIWSVMAGAQQLIGPSGWIVQWDAVAKVVQGQIQVYYKDKVASAPIQFTTRGSCYENMLIIDIQQVKALP